MRLPPLLLLLGASCALAPEPAGLHIALHAQSKSSLHGWVAGSEITTRGLARALSAHPRVAHVQVFAPFAYEGFETHPSRWDVLVFEGYIGTVGAVARAARRHSPHVVVLHWVLDTYPSLKQIAALDVDGFLTNSLALWPKLDAVAPTAHVMLAADTDAMRPVAPRPEYAADVVYLGQFSRTKDRLAGMLDEVVANNATLHIWGNGWDNDSQNRRFLKHWRGVLPSGDIPALYASAGLVLGTTEAAQRALGMVNNRVFEALSCGAPLLLDSFPAAEAASWGGFVRWRRGEGDVARHVRAVLADPAAARAASLRGRAHVVAAHSYAARAARVLRHVDVVRGRRTGRRPNGPTVHLVYDDDDGGVGDVERAVLGLEPHAGYRVALHAANASAACAALARRKDGILLVRAEAGGALERQVRAGCAGRRGLLHRGSQGGCCAPWLVENYDVVVRDHDRCAPCDPPGLGEERRPAPVELGRRPPAASAEPWRYSGAVGGPAVPALTVALDEALQRAFDRPSAAAAIALREPADRSIVTCRAAPGRAGVTLCRVRVHVRITAFRMPDDGMWCLRTRFAHEDAATCFGDNENCDFPAGDSCALATDLEFVKGESAPLPQEVQFQASLHFGVEDRRPARWSEEAAVLLVGPAEPIIEK